MKKKQQRRSDCPISFGLEAFGDLWSLLIIRDVVYFGKQTYGEFLVSGEGIATNILADRLIHLEAKGILIKQPHPKDKRKEIYRLTDKGLDLIPIVFEIAMWGAKHDSQTGASQEWLDLVKQDRERIIQLTREAVQNGRSVFEGDDSVFNQLLGEAPKSA